MVFNGSTMESKEAQASKQEGEPDEEVIEVPDDEEREDHVHVCSAFVCALGQLFTPFLFLSPSYSGSKKCPNVCMFFTKVDSP